jgi:uncharacterized membrane protein YedE/YeeE
MSAFESIPLWRSLAGGALIGAGAGVLILWNGRVAGISGILGRALRGDVGEAGWRLAFLAGLVLPGLLLGPGAVVYMTGPWVAALAGLLVGYGTGIGSGCTSGHGVCGMANLSLRSLVATAVFVSVAMLTVLATRHVGLP